MSNASIPLWQLDALELAHLMRSGAVSCHEVMHAHIERMEAVNPQLNAVVLSLAEQALAQADALDRAGAYREEPGPLYGVPVTIKVNTDLEGTPNDNGVVALKDNIAPGTNPCAENLLRAGGIVLGRTNTPCYSMRWHTDNALHGATRNPWDLSRTSGGSSGGASASVASGIAPIGQGNDIAGSVRYPAYCCGLVGVRPSLGRVPSFNPSGPAARPISAQFMAVQGPLTRSVRDARAALAAMSVGDVNDARWVDTPLRGPAIPRPTRVALVRSPAGHPVHPSVTEALDNAGQWLSEAGYQVEEVSPPELETAIDLWARMGMDDVIRALDPHVQANGDEGIKRSVAYWRRGNPGTGAQGVLDALVERDHVLRLWQVFLEDYPLMVMPSSDLPAFEANEDIADFESFQRLWSAQWPQLALPVLGLPGVAVPTGLHDGLPSGVQIVSRRFREDWCLDAAEAIEARVELALPVSP